MFEDIGRRSGSRPAPLFRRAELRGGGELRAFTQLGRISFKMGLCTAGGGKGCNKIVGSYITIRAVGG